MHDQWRFIRSGYLSGAMNMALDEALFEAVSRGDSPPVLRLYRWRPAALTLGYAQRAEETVDLEACRRLELDVVRRATGGRAVLHDRELTYAVIAPEGRGVFPGGILDNYRVIAEVLLETVLSLGVAAELVPCRPSQGRENAGHRSACFSAPSSYELVVDGRKIAGSAQKRGAGTFLQHGSIPVEMDLEKLFQALDATRCGLAEEGVRRLDRSVGWLNRYASQALTVTQVEERLAACFSARVGAEMIEDEPTAGEMSRARRMAEEKYRSLVLPV